MNKSNLLSLLLIGAIFNCGITKAYITPQILLGTTTGYVLGYFGTENVDLKGFRAVGATLAAAALQELLIFSIRSDLNLGWEIGGYAETSHLLTFIASALYYSHRKKDEFTLTSRKMA